MGATLPKAVESTVVERHDAKGFRMGVAEMNGWRPNMEDAHLAHIRDDWSFFGVFDGHGGAACSKFVAPRISKELEENGCPADDAAVKKMLFAVDQEFLDGGEESGSTGTMCIVNKPDKEGAKHKLRVINAGDSRVLLGRRDGSIVDGGGTDQGLTTDHKPDHPDEKERIYRCGGTVDTQSGGVARVNGDLAVSRSFGDAKYKTTGGPGPEDRPVTVDPELKEFECDGSDFLLLVCDGVSEGNFPNADVVKLVAQILKDTDDPGQAAKAVCHKAVEKDSKDNISCMVVLLDGTPETRKSADFEPGATDKLGHSGYKTAYTAMAEKAGLSLAQAVEKRFDMLQVTPEELDRMQNSYLGSSTTLKEEVVKLGKPTGEPGSKEREEYFQKWIDELPEESSDGPDMSSLLGGKGAEGMGKGMGKGDGKGKKGGGGDEPEVEKQENGYTWSQKDEEVQVTFKLPKAAKKGDVKVQFKPASLEVSAFGEKLLGGKLAGKVEVDDCTWTLQNTNELQVTLFTSQDKWKSLLA